MERTRQTNASVKSWVCKLKAAQHKGTQPLHVVFSMSDYMILFIFLFLGSSFQLQMVYFFVAFQVLGVQEWARMTNMRIRNIVYIHRIIEIHRITTTNTKTTTRTTAAAPATITTTMTMTTTTTTATKVATPTGMGVGTSAAVATAAALTEHSITSRGLTLE